MADNVSLQQPEPRVYLGDGLYAEFDGYHVRLYAHDGFRRTNEVFLEPDVLAEFLRFIESLKGGPVAAR